MGSVNLTTDVPRELQLNIFSFLNEDDLKAAACVCKAFESLSKDFQIWKLKTEARFGKLIANDARMTCSDWKETYNKLESSQKEQTSNISKVLQTHTKKVQDDNLRQRTQRAAALLGFPIQNPDTHYYPTGQVGHLGNFKVTVSKSTNQNVNQQ